MKKAAAHSTTTVAVHPKSHFIDTTWRIIAPVAICTAAGILADSYVGSKPWLALLGVAIGFGVAGILVKHQIGGLPTDEQ